MPSCHKNPSRLDSDLSNRLPFLPIHYTFVYSSARNRLQAEQTASKLVKNGRASDREDICKHLKADTHRC